VITRTLSIIAESTHHRCNISKLTTAILSITG